MAKLVALSVLLVVAAVSAETDWSKVKTFAPFLDSRIVGGEEAVPNSIPHQVGLLVKVPQGTAFCGGSIISPTDIITAAHCVDAAEEIEVVVGAHRIREEESTQQRFVTKDFTYHEGWDRFRLINDVAIIRLPQPIELNENAKIIALPKRSDEGQDLAGKTAIVSGWGITQDGANSISEVLNFVEREIITNDACNIAFLGTVQPTHVCTSGKGGKSPCSGDSGGPLVVENTQVGLVSFGFIKCQWGFPGVFTRLVEYLDWIKANSNAQILD